MLYVILGIVILTVLYAVIKFIQSSTPRGFAMGIAKAQLISFYSLRNYSPNTSIEQLYLQTIMTRPGYSEELCNGIFLDAKSLSQQMNMDFKFWIVVLQLVAYEYLSRTGQSPISNMDTFRQSVVTIIPADL